MQNVKIENWEKFDICFLRLSPVKEDVKGIPLEDKSGEPVLDTENAAVVCALPQMRLSRTVGIYSSIWQKIRSVFNPLLKELIDTVKYTKKLLRGVSSKTTMVIPRKKLSRTDGKGRTGFYETTVQPEDYNCKPEDVRGSLGELRDPEKPSEDGITVRFGALHARMLVDILDAGGILGVFRGETGNKDFSEGRSLLKKMIGKYVIWDLCDADGKTIDSKVGDAVAA